MGRRTVIPPEMKQDMATAGAKLAAGPGVVGVGMLTLNDLALVFGILCSLAIFIQTVLNIVWKWRDRQKRATRTAQDE